MKNILFLFTILLSQSIMAQTLSLKPGLYQITSKIIIDGKPLDQNGEMKKMMAEQAKAMSPEMIKQMKSMNINMPAMPDPNNIQACITAKDLTPESIAKSQNEKTCKYKTIKHTAKEINITFTCADGTESTSVTKISSDKQYSSRTVTKNKKVKKDQITEMDSVGKWISSTCTKESIKQSKGIFN